MREEAEREEIERGLLIVTALTANTPEKYEQAEELIIGWMRRHPRDFGMLDAGEQLAMMSGKYEPASEEAQPRP